MILPYSSMKMEDWLSFYEDYNDLYEKIVIGNIAHNLFRCRANIPLRKMQEWWFSMHRNIVPKIDWEKMLHDSIKFNPKRYITMNDEMYVSETESELLELFISDNEQDQFRLQCILERDKLKQSHLLRIDTMIAEYVSNYYIRQVKDKKHFLDSAKWFVTVKMFEQLPYVFSPTPEMKKIYNDVMKHWNPNWFVLKFCTRINETFEKL